jgi:hypothetical protein
MREFRQTICIESLFGWLIKHTRFSKKKLYVDKWIHEPRSNFNHKKHLFNTFIRTLFSALIKSENTKTYLPPTNKIMWRHEETSAHLVFVSPMVFG